jgi:predicted RNA-binding Zn ribbon-like protein
VIVRPLTAYADEADGLVIPARLAGHPALDFCNTFAGWGDPRGGDYLKTFDHLAVWTAAAGLLEEAEAPRLRRRAARDPEGAASELRRALSLREALYRVCTDRSRRTRAWDLVAGEAHAASAAAVLVRTETGAEWRLPDGLGLALPVAAVARSAADLLTSADLEAVGRCPGEQCGWLFLDPTGRRRWCTMAVCGNRAKVRRFAERARALQA